MPSLPIQTKVPAGTRFSVPRRTLFTMSTWMTRKITTRAVRWLSTRPSITRSTWKQSTLNSAFDFRQSTIERGLIYIRGRSSNVYDTTFLSVCLSVCVSVTRRRILGNYWNQQHQTWHGDCLWHENASRINYINLDLHPRSHRPNTKCSSVSEMVEATPIIFAVKIVRLMVYKQIVILSQSDELDLHLRSQPRLKVDNVLTCSLV